MGAFGKKYTLGEATLGTCDICHEMQRTVRLVKAVNDFEVKPPLKVCGACRLNPSGAQELLKRARGPKLP